MRALASQRPGDPGVSQIVDMRFKFAVLSEAGFLPCRLRLKKGMQQLLCFKCGTKWKVPFRPSGAGAGGEGQVGIAVWQLARQAVTECFFCEPDDPARRSDECF